MILELDLKIPVLDDSERVRRRVMAPWGPPGIELVGISPLPCALDATQVGLHFCPGIRIGSHLPSALTAVV